MCIPFPVQQALRACCVAQLMLSAICHAAPFTAIGTGSDYLQDAATNGILYEVVNAYRERREFIDGGLRDLPEAGDDVQRRSGTTPIDAWYNMQDWYRDNYAAWLATNTLPAAGSTNAPANYASLPEFYAAASMSTNGYRRATVYDPDAGDDWTVLYGGMWTNAGNGYGRMAVGDIIGPWILDDLQRSASACQARQFQPHANASGIAERRGHFADQTYSYTEATANAYRSNAVANWAAATNAPKTSGDYYSIAREHYAGLLLYYGWTGERRHSTPAVTNIATSLAYDWDAILLPTAPAGGDYWDGDGLGWTEGVWVAHDSGAGSGATIATDLLTGVDTNTIPLDIAPALTYPTYTNQGCRVTDIRIIVSPAFSHTR